VTAQDFLGYLNASFPSLVGAFTALMQADPQAAEAVAQKFALGGPDQQRVIEMLTALAEQMGGGGAPPMGDPSLAPPNGPPMGAPPGMPDPSMMGDPPMGDPMMMAGPPPGMGGMPPLPMDPAMMGQPPPMMGQPPPPTDQATADAQARNAQTIRRAKKERRKNAPKFELRDLPENRWGKGPSEDRILRDAQEGRRRWASRDDRIREDIQLFNAHRSIDMLNGKPFDVRKGDVVHISTRAYQFAERLAGLCAATHDKAKYQAPPWSDDDETRFAAQAMEDWWKYERHCDEDLWFRRGAMGDPQMPLPRYEAGLMVLMGGLGFRLWFEPSDKQHPTRYEVIPLNRLYPLAHAITHQVNLTLGEARAIYREIDEYYPPEKEDGPEDSLSVRVIGWSDVYPDGQGGLWHAILWEQKGVWTGRWGDKEQSNKEHWIKKPQRIDYGFSPYQYVIWGGAPYGATDSVAEFERFRGMGALTMLRRTFKLMDLLQSAIATGAIRMADPPKVQYYLPGTRREDMEGHDTRPGATNYGIVGEQTQPLVFTVAGGPDGQALLGALATELSYFDSPILHGAGNAESGYDRVQQNSAAGSLHVNPIIDALEQMYELINTLRAELIIRKGIGEDREVEKLVYSGGGSGFFDQEEYTSGATDSPLDYEPDYAQMGVMKYITPKMIELNGTRSEVRFDRLSIPEKQMLWTMLGQAVSQKLLAAREAMEQMGVQNPDRNLFRILAESAVMNPKALDSMIGAAALGSQNRLFTLGWQAVMQAEMMGGQQGSAPAPIGVPSASGNPGMGGPSGMPPAIAQGIPPG
jgi:hypothetical protein